MVPTGERSLPTQKVGQLGDVGGNSPCFVPFASEIDDGMPVLLSPEQFEPWLSGEVGVEYLKPALDDLLQKWPVSRRANSSKARTDDPSPIEEVAAPSDQTLTAHSSARQRSLF